MQILTERRVSSDLIDSGIVDQYVRARQGVCQALFRRHVPGDEFAALARDPARRGAVGIANQNFQNPAAGANAPHDRLPDKPRAAGQEDSHGRKLR